MNIKYQSNTIGLPCARHNHLSAHESQQQPRRQEEQNNVHKTPKQQLIDFGVKPQQVTVHFTETHADTTHRNTGAQYHMYSCQSTHNTNNHEQQNCDRARLY